MPGQTSYEELASLPSFHHPAASPDGERVAVYYDGSGRNELHVIDAATGEMRRVSDGEVPRNARWPFMWAPGGDRIYFHVDDDGNEQNDIHAIDLDGNVEPVVEMDGQCVLADVRDDGERLLLTSSAGGQMNLYAHDLSSGETERLTEYEQAVWGGGFSPDGERIAYTTNESDDLDNRDVYVMNADGSDPRNLGIGEEGCTAAFSGWSPDGTELLVGDDTEDTSRCGIYGLETDEIEWFGEGEYVERPVGFLPDGSGFLALRIRNAAVVPRIYRRDGSSEELDLPEGVAAFPGYGDAAFLGDGRVLVEQTTPTSRPTLLDVDLDTGETTTLIEPEYGNVDPESFTDAEYVTFESHGVDGGGPSAGERESHGGLEIGGLLYDVDARPSPAVVLVHGGPAAQDLKSFHLQTQFLTALGYSVFRINYRGSTGRGREFKNSLNMDWGGAEQADIAAGTRWLKEKDWIDEERVAVYGGSYGGYSAYWQMVTYPELYACGIAWVGVTDLHDMYENTMPHFKTGLMEKYLGDPGENHDLYRERSPVEYVENLSSPLLMVHGVNDRRVPVSQARLFRDALVEQGYEEGEDGIYEYEELGEEGHGSTDIDQKIRSFELVADFLERRMPAN